MSEVFYCSQPGCSAVVLYEPHVVFADIGKEYKLKRPARIYLRCDLGHCNPYMLTACQSEEVMKVGMNLEREIPGPNEVIRTSIPDSLTGIRYEFGRLVKYIIEGSKDPLVISTAQKITGLAMGTARQLKQKVTEKTRDLIAIKGIHAWCHANFEPVSNPANVEVIKTPARMLRELEIPEEIARAMWEPIKDAMAKDSGKDPAKLTFQKPKITGNSAMATCLILTLALAVGITPMRMRLGGAGGNIHYIWGNVWVDDRWYDVDVLVQEIGKHKEFEQYETCDIPV